MYRTIKMALLAGMIALMAGVWSGYAVAQEEKMIGQWETTIQTDAFDDSKNNVVGALQMIEGTKMVVVIARCRRDELSFFVVIQATPLNKEEKFGQREVGTRVGKNPPKFNKWWMNDTKNALFHYKPLDIMNEILNSQSNQLAIRYTTQDSVDTLIFDTTGAKELFPLVKDACGTKE